MNVDALIFDCDGVLIDSEIVVCRIVAEELSALGYAISTEQVVARFAGRPEHEMLAEIEQDRGKPVPAFYKPRVHDRTMQAYGTELKGMPGIAEALSHIEVPLCVASSSYPEKLRLGLENAGLYKRFAPNVLSATLVAHGKPEPDLFLFAAGWMKTSPMRCLVIEDSVPGVRAAVRAGIPVLGFTGGTHCGPGHAEALLAAGAVSTFSHMAHLPLFIGAGELASSQTM